MPFNSPLDNVFEYAKDTVAVTELLCGWTNCFAILNSWRALAKHLQCHCKQVKKDLDVYQCQYEKCAGRSHESYHALLDHMKLSHLSRIPLPCPVQDCLQVFYQAGRQELLLNHIKSNHSELLQNQASTSKVALKTSWIPVAPRDPNIAPKVPEIPLGLMESHLLLGPRISRGRKRQRRSFPGAKIERQRSQLDVARDTRETTRDPDDSELQLGDLPIPPRMPDFKREFTYFVVRRKPAEPALQLARPQPIAHPPLREKTPPRSMGYSAFGERVAALARAGLLDGSGMWPPSRDNTPA